MKKLTFGLLGSLFILVLTGCEGMRYAQYSGPVKTWPTGTAFSDKVFDVPVYRGWPERPYEVLGRVEFKNPNIDWNQGDMKQAARMAKQAGGDALLLIPKGDTTSPTLTAVRGDLGIDASRMVGLVAKWK